MTSLARQAHNRLFYPVRDINSRATLCSPYKILVLYPPMPPSPYMPTHSWRNPPRRSCTFLNGHNEVTFPTWYRYHTLSTAYQL